MRNLFPGGRVLYNNLDSGKILHFLVLSKFKAIHTSHFLCYFLTEYLIEFFNAKLGRVEEAVVIGIPVDDQLQS